MRYSSSEDDHAPTGGTKATATRYSHLDETGTSTTITAFQRRRLEYEKRKQERERRMHRERERHHNHDEDDDEDSEADLLAAESPLASPSPPQSPLVYRATARNSSPSPALTHKSYKNDVAIARQRGSPAPAAAALKDSKFSRKSGASPSPVNNRVAFAATTTTMKKNNQQQPNGQRNIIDYNYSDSLSKPKRKRLEYCSSSDDSEDFGEKMKQRLQQMKRDEMAKEGATAKLSIATIGPSSPFKHHRSFAKTTTKTTLAHLQQSESSDDEDMSSKLQARKLAERNAKYNRHNPIHMERRKQEEWEEERHQQHQRLLQQRQLQQHTATHAGGLEGTTILVDGDQKSVSEMGDDNRIIRKGGIGGNSPGGAWKQSRRYSPGLLKRDDNDGDNNDDDDSPLKKKKKQRIIIDSDEDGLWDDDVKVVVDDDDVKTKKKKGDEVDDDSDADGDKKPRGKSVRPKGKHAATTTAQSRKRQRGHGALKVADNDDDLSQTSEQSKRQAKTTKKDAAAASKKQTISRFASLLQSSDIDNDEDDDKSVSEQDKEDMKRDLKPTFLNPKLGPPSDLVPFVLSKEWKPGDPITNQVSGEDDGRYGKSNGDDNVDKVPASINRYLAPYQRQGVQFMYKSVVHGKGCVLGDDMGLGKTVQIISLIAALLKKTGTALDKENILSHQRKVLKVVKTREENDRQALLMGMCSRVKNSPISEEVGLPGFAPILVIAPPSVTKNWENEFSSWGHFNVAPIYGGSGREKALDRIKIGLDFILIVGKSTFTRADDFEALISVHWKMIIVDEYHEYKNHASAAHMRLADLRDKSACPVIGMTGTLMQNNHKELYHLIDMVRPGLFGDWSTFRTDISDPLKYARAKDAKAECVSMGKDRQKVLDRMLKPVYLVRKKEEALKDNLTKKNEKVVFCQLSDVQKQLYRHILTLPDYDLLRFANAPCECGVNTQYFIRYKKLKTKKEQIAYQRRHKDQLKSKKRCCFRYPRNPYWDDNDLSEPFIDPDAILWKQLHDKPIGDPDSIEEDILDNKYITCKQCPSCIQLPAMMKLMKICSHPSLLQVAHSEVGESKRKKLEFAEVALPPEIRSKLPGGTLYQYESLTNNHVKLSGKMKTLDYLLKKFQRQQNRVLVFSHSTATLDIIQNHCRISGWEHLRLDGKTPSSSRQVLVDKFQKNNDIFVFLISTKAGGLGLNLTAANKVIIFDVNWNPSYDEQAQDRAFRIGQKKDVEVTRLVARGTIEELIYQRQVYKVQLKKQTLEATELGEDQPQIFRGVDKDKNRKGELFGIENLLKFKDGSFMSSLWKKADNPLEAIDEAAVQAELDKRTEDDLDELAEKDDEAPSKTNINESGNETSDNEYEGIDHGDYFNKQRGRARVVQGDDAFDEEMGGVSQMIAATTAMAVQNVYSTDDDASNEEEADTKPHVKPDINLVAKPPLRSIQEVTSPANDSGATPSPAAEDEKNEPGSQSDVDRNSDSKEEEEEKKDKKEKSANADNQIMSPEPSTGTQSMGSLEGLRTQHEPTPKMIEKRKTAPAKFSLMGVSFEKSPNKNQPEKKPSGLYIPSYSKEEK